MIVTVYAAGVFDGDTFYTSNSESIRLADVNAPETGTLGAPYATDLLYSLVGQQFVQVETVAKDPYGRFVCNVWVNGKDVNETMRRAGFT